MPITIKLAWKSISRASTCVPNVAQFRDWGGYRRLQRWKFGFKNSPFPLPFSFPPLSIFFSHPSPFFFPSLPYFTLLSPSHSFPLLFFFPPFAPFRIPSLPISLSSLFLSFPTPPLFLLFLPLSFHLFFCIAVGGVNSCCRFLRRLESLLWFSSVF